MTVAWDYLSDLEKVQLLHLRPDLQEDYDRHKGGRPRLPSLVEVRQQSASEVQNQDEGGNNRLPNGLKELKKLYALRNQVGGAD